jgi:hypothetical protein
MVTLRAERLLRTGSIQAEEQEFSSTDDALRAACLKLAMNLYINMSIVSDQTDALEKPAIIEICSTRQFHPETLVVRAYEILKQNLQIAELGIEDIWLFPNPDSIVIQTAMADGPLYQASLRISEWQSTFADNPAGLADLLLRGLPSRRPVMQPTITDKRYLFLRTYDDLLQRCDSDDEYTMLGISSLLRLLLWDERPLVDQINRRFRQKIVFRVGKVITPNLVKDQPAQGRLRLISSGLSLHAVENAFYASDTATEYQNLNKDQFYRLPVLQVGEHVFTVLELMQHMAYVGGTIHAFDPSEDRDQALHEFRGLSQMQGVGPGLRTLRAIGRVVADALIPLRDTLVLQLSGLDGSDAKGSDDSSLKRT